MCIYCYERTSYKVYIVYAQYNIIKLKQYILTQVHIAHIRSRPCRDRMQSVPITTNVVSWNSSSLRSVPDKTLCDKICH
jgi:hypothetical protein